MPRPKFEAHTFRAQFHSGAATPFAMSAYASNTVTTNAMLLPCLESFVKISSAFCASKILVFVFTKPYVVILF